MPSTSGVSQQANSTAMDIHKTLCCAARRNPATVDSWLLVTAAPLPPTLGNVIEAAVPSPAS
jgi:hypothetical protein